MMSKLVDDYLANRITLTELTDEQLDDVVEGLTEIGENMLGTENHDAGVAMLKALDLAIDLRQPVDELFEEAIIAAESRGSTYWEFESYSVH